MSKTRSKQGIEEKWGHHSNVSKTIVKQGIEGILGYCDNGPITIGESDFEGGMTTYGQKCKTAEIYNRKSEGGFAQQRSMMIVAPHHPKANVIVVLIYQCYQQILR